MDVNNGFWLSVEMSGRVSSIALHRDRHGTPVQLLGEAELPAGNRQLETLLPTIHSKLHSLDLTPGQLVGCLSTYGPGSFTGLRTAIASLKGWLAAVAAKLELLSAAEAVLLSWAEEHRPPEHTIASVFSYISTARTVRSRYTLRGESWELVSEEVVSDRCTVDSGEFCLSCEPEVFKRLELSGFICQLGAATLAQVRCHAKYSRVYLTSAEIELAAPDYYASEFRRSIGP